MNKKTNPLVLESFVGRDDVVQAFHATLNDPRRKPVFFFCGEGGIGKTWLLHRLLQEVQGRDDLVVASGIVDLAATRYHRISGVREEIIQFLGHEHFQDFQAAQADFVAERDKPDGERVAESAIRGRQARADGQFMADCRRAIGNRTAILWFDTFERVSREQVGSWILHELPAAVPSFFVVVAGRPGPNEDACPPEDDQVQLISLKGLPSKNATAFFAARAVSSAQEPALPFSPDSPLPVPPTHEVLAALYDKLDGHPLKLDLAILWLKTGIRDINQLQDFLDQGTLDQELLKPLRQLGRVPGVVPDDVSEQDRAQLEAAAFEVILLMAYLNRRFDEHFLERVYALPRPTLDQAKRVMSRLPQMYFVKERTGGVLQLHDEMERLVVEYLWNDRDPTGDFRDELAQDAIQVYDDLIAECEDEREREELNAERLGYQLRVDVQRGYEENFVESFQRNLENREFGLCELLLIELGPYEEALKWPQKAQVDDFRFRLALARRDLDLAKELAQGPKQQVQFLFELHSATWETQPRQAIQTLLEALEICERHELSRDEMAGVQRALGFTYRVLGQWEQAIEWYRRCQETAKAMGRGGAWLYADTQNSEGFVYALMGAYDKANTLIEQALKLRQRLGRRFEEGQSYSTWGEANRFAGDYRSANRYYNQALEIFKELRDPLWQAIVLQQLGENARRIAEKMRAQGDVEGDQRRLEYALDNFAGSQVLYERYNLHRDRSKLFRRLGRALRDAGRLEEAEARLQQGYDMASDNQDRREQLECQSSLAWLALRQNDFEKVMRFTKSLLQVEPEIADYLVFMGRAHVQRGRAYAVRQEWDKALDEFATGLVQFGQSLGYGRERLHSHLKDLRQALDEIPDVETKRAWCKHLIAAWQREELEEDLPELVEMCRRYEESLSFL